ncbi:uncharacterized protein LOC135156122 [Lytechinus pictus]|uniref:uncharacterized protein LOC135156122 n=1 Tax=Lytechinus pictus TaxID=7653 RepID=UPI0030B9C246
METVQDILYEHVSTEDRYSHTRGPHSTRKHQQTLQPQHDTQQHLKQEGYHHPHHHHHPQLPPQPHPPHQMPNGWVEKSAFADCSPPPTNSPTRELDNQEHSEAMREAFNNSYSSGSTERSKYEELSSEDKRRGNSLYDIEEAREQVDDVLDNVEEADNNKNDVQTPPVAEENVEESKIGDAKEKEPSVNGQNGFADVDGDGAEEEVPGESGNEQDDDEDDFSDDSYEESVPEYQKAPLSTKLRIKNWLAGLENSSNESSSRIDRFLPEIM